jgi:uncharacterized protein YndB with AHSA1/START domain
MHETNEPYDWSSFDVHMDVNAPIETVYDAWATGRGMISFFTRTLTYRTADGRSREPDERAIAGDTYSLEFHHPSGFSGRVIDAESPHRFIFTFPDVMHVEVRLTEADGCTRVHLQQRNIATDPEGVVSQHLNCRSCWIYYLMNLKSVLEHGHDLRDVDRPIDDNIVSVSFRKTLTGASAGE